MEDQKIFPEFHNKEGVALATAKCTTSTGCTTTGKVNSGWIYRDNYGISQGSSYGPLKGPISGFGCPTFSLIERIGQPLGVCLPTRNENKYFYSVLSANITASGAIVGLYEDYYGTSSTCNTTAIGSYNPPQKNYWYYTDYRNHVNTSSCFKSGSDDNLLYSSLHYSTSPPPDPALTNPYALYQHSMTYSDAACSTPVLYDYSMNSAALPAGSPSPGCFISTCQYTHGK